jgi:sulfur carrier protein
MTEGMTEREPAAGQPATQPPPPTGATVLVNGDRRPLPPGGELTSLLATLGIDDGTTGVAVAVNGTVVPRAGWSRCRLTPQDEVEVVRAVPGG